MRSLAPVVAALTLIAASAGASPATIRVCPDCAVHSLADGLSLLAAGDTLVLGPGLYHDAGVLNADRVTIKAEPGAHLVGAVAEGKAALVVKGNQTVIEGLECSRIRVPDGNGACVRLEGSDLVLRGVNFHDSEQGLLTGPDAGTVVIENSRFERLGAGGHAHGVYAAECDALLIRHSVFLSGADQGHEIKSRAARTVIENSLVASMDGIDSRLVDVPNGGEVVIRNSVLEKGTKSSNGELIGYGLEGLSHKVNSLRLEGGTFIIDRRPGHLVHSVVTPEMAGIVVVGGERIDAVTWYPNRAAAKLPPYPGLPEVGGTGMTNTAP